MSNSTLRIIGLIAAVSTALVGQAELIGEPWHHWLSIIGIISAVVIAYYQQPPRDYDSRDRVSDNTLKEIQNGSTNSRSIT